MGSGANYVAPLDLRVGDRTEWYKVISTPAVIGDRVIVEVSYEDGSKGQREWDSVTANERVVPLMHG